MAIKSSGNPLSFQEIEDEFGQNPGRSLGRYRNSHPDFKNENLGELTDLPLDTGIPKTGEIKFSDFYSKQANIVVDLFESGNANHSLNVFTNRFLNGDYHIVGKYRTTVSKNTWQGGKKVIIHINKTFGSAGAPTSNAENAIDTVAVDMGNIDNNNSNHWPTATDFQIDVGSEGLVGGRGGRGGNAGNEESAGENGLHGTSGMKIHPGFQDEISGESRIFGGGGGGGSGSGSEQNDWGDRNSAGGGAGGGGAGIPAGADGTANGSGENGGTGDAPGNNDGGDGGSGADDAEAEGGNGGNGGGRNSNGGNATNGKNLAGGNGNGGNGGAQYRFY